MIGAAWLSKPFLRACGPNTNTTSQSHRRGRGPWGLVFGSARRWGRLQDRASKTGIGPPTCATAYFASKEISLIAEHSVTFTASVHSTCSPGTHPSDYKQEIGPEFGPMLVGRKQHLLADIKPGPDFWLGRCNIERVPGLSVLGTDLGESLRRSELIAKMWSSVVVGCFCSSKNILLQQPGTRTGMGPLSVGIPAGQPRSRH